MPIISWFIEMKFIQMVQWVVVQGDAWDSINSVQKNVL